MAESILTDLLGRELDCLFKYGEEEIKLYFGGRKKLDELKMMMRMIQARLKDAETRREAEERALVKEWLKEIRSVLYRLQDLFEEVTMAEELKEKEAKGIVTKAVSYFSRLKFNKKVSQEALDIKGKLEQLTAAMNMFNFNVHPIDRDQMCTMSMIKWREETDSFIKVDEVIGRDEENESIVKMLLESKEDLSVIPIVGMGGLGKTTLAKLAYNHKEVQQHFELKCWVCVSDGITSLEELVQRVVKPVIGREDPQSETSELLSKLREALRGKKYLLVLDDVWIEDREMWLKLEKSLHGGKPGSKILVTSRSEVVASKMGTIQPYILKGLSEKKSWALFKALAFKEGQEETNPSLISIGKEIVKQCGNVPLAIRTIAGLLHSEETEREWLRLKNRGIGRINEEQNSIMPTLKLSYDYLPPHLKKCFAYCSLFVEDYEFNVDMLIWLWIAQGFVVPEEEESPYDVGYSYFMQLLRRCFFQQVYSRDYGKISYCKMHDLMHELAKTVGDECLFVDSRTPRQNLNDNIWHVHYYPSNSEIWLFGSPRMQSIRTFFSSKPVDLVQVSLSLRQIRALHLGSSVYESLPDAIGELKHLRYLQVKVSRLPSAITKLQRLETLDLRDSKYLRELPSDFHKLATLRHLLLSPYSSLIEMPPRFGELKSLQVLDKFIIGENNGLDAMFGMNLIGKLTIQCKKHRESGIWEAKKANLKEKRLSHMILYGSNVHKEIPIDVVDELLECLQPPRTLKSLEIRFWVGERFPTWGMGDFARLFPNLADIKLTNCPKWKNIAYFSQLYLLKNLELCDLVSVEYIEVITGGSYNAIYFPCLEILTLSYMPTLKGWSKIEYQGKRQDVQQPPQCLFPRLLYLSIRGCPKLKSLPGTKLLFEAQDQSLLQLYSSLKTLTLQECEGLNLWNVNNLNSCFWKGLKSLTSLELTKMSKLVLLPSGIDDLPTLEQLKIKSLHNLKSLPDTIGNLTTLKELTVGNLPNLKALPDSIGNLVQLQTLEISNCPNMESLPQSIRNLTTLKRLEIRHCPKLVIKYRKCFGDEWPLIKHIPLVDVY